MDRDIKVHTTDGIRSNKKKDLHEQLLPLVGTELPAAFGNIGFLGLQNKRFRAGV